LAGQTNRHDIAVDLISRAIAILPNNSKAHNNLGNSLLALRQPEEAIASYRRALSLDPASAEIHSSLGFALFSLGRFDEAIDSCRRALAIDPDFVAAHNNLGMALGASGQRDDAIACYRRAMKLQPENVPAQYNLGNALLDKGDIDQAIACYRQAQSLEPDNVEVLGSLARATTRAGQPQEAVACYRRILMLKPDDIDIHGSLVLSLHYLPDYDAQSIAEEHRRWNRQYAEPLKKFIQPHANDRNPDRRLRVGYVSPDFRKHAVAWSVLPLLECHDSENFEVFCYAEVPKPDATTERFRAQADQWRSTVGLSDEQIADLIRRDQIDILVDLAGHTAGNRLLVFARKPAPVQVTRLGYPNTTGLTAIDYRMTDAYADPPGLSDSLHSEQLIRLPQTNWIYQPPDNGPAPSQRPQGGSVKFGCFNNLNKITEPMLKIWAKILAAVPGSTLLLKANALTSPEVQQRVRRIFKAEHISFERVELVGWTESTEDHLALYNQIAIGLDPYPYHGTMSTCEAMWMGVPVITLAGQTHVSRVGVSLLSNMGLKELIAESPKEYIRIAVELANDIPRLRNLHSTLRRRMEQSPLMDAPKFARNVEAAYRQMWRTWCASG
jgi:predicted O-linked N-acetylglucosamine transferase (SPINDLY family)